MTLFDVDQFKELANREAELCISIFTPTERVSPNGYQASKIHFKNALTEARNQLIDQYGLTPEKADDFLAEGWQLIDNLEFWKYSSDMLAYYLFDGEGVAIKLPLPINEPLCRVGKRPYLLPLIPELTDDGHFYLLDLNLQGVTLYEVSRSVVQPIDLPDTINTSYTEEIEDNEYQKALQHRSGFGQAGAMFHGQGSGSDEDKKVEILNFFHRLSTDLDAILNKNPLPLLLAGVNYLIPIYKQASNYTHIVEPNLTGSYGPNDMVSLSTEAWDVMEPYFREARQARKNEYQLFSARAQGDSETDTVLLTAISGGVDTLFIQSGAELWGTFDQENYTIQIDDSPSPENYSLIDEAARRTIESGGKVYIVEADNMPAPEALVAGIFRYPIAEVVDDTSTASN